MRAKLLLTFGSVIGAAPLAPFQLSEPLGMEWYSNNTNFTTTWTKPFNITHNYLSGFSSGSMMSTNLMRMHPEAWEGFGLLAGIITQNMSKLEPVNFGELPLSNIKDKPVFGYLGTKDMQDAGYWQQSMAWLQDNGAKVTKQLIHDFTHVVPSNLPVDEEWHREGSCNVRDGDVVPPKRGSRNCGYNLAWYMLQTWFGEEPLKERALNHTQLGDFHAFNQSAFVDDNTEAKLGEIGYIYIPHACKDGAYCKTVMFLHGCLQAAGIWKETEARRMGLIEYAATNNLIVIFPQNDDMVMMELPGQDPFPFQYCWSTGQVNASDKYHPQMLSLLNMLNSLVLGSEDATQAEVTADTFEAGFSKAALAQMAANKQLMDIDQTLSLSDDILLI